MMQELGVTLICAHSPQAKGRIERLFCTLQDRLVKEMSLRNLKTIEEANQFLEVIFWNQFNSRWNCVPAEPTDVHRKVPSDHVLDKIFTVRETRKISKSLDFSYDGTLCQVKTKQPNRLSGKQITIFQGFEGEWWVESDGKKLHVSIFKDQPKQTPIEGAKTINPMMDNRRKLTTIERHRRGINCPR